MEVGKLVYYNYSLIAAFAKFDMWTLLVGKILGTYICWFPANAAISVPVPALLYNGPVICSPRNEKTCKILFFINRSEIMLHLIPSKGND